MANWGGVLAGQQGWGLNGFSPAVSLSDADLAAIASVAFAETDPSMSQAERAANMAMVAQTVLGRMADTGMTAQQVLSQSWGFEPVAKGLVDFDNVDPLALGAVQFAVDNSQDFEAPRSFQNQTTVNSRYGPNQFSRGVDFWGVDRGLPGQKFGTIGQDPFSHAYGVVAPWSSDPFTVDNATITNVDATPTQTPDLAPDFYSPAMAFTSDQGMVAAPALSADMYSADPMFGGDFSTFAPDAPMSFADPSVQGGILAGAMANIYGGTPTPTPNPMRGYTDVGVDAATPAADFSSFDAQPAPAQVASVAPNSLSGASQVGFSPDTAPAPNAPAAAQYGIGPNASAVNSSLADAVSNSWGAFADAPAATPTAFGSATAEGGMFDSLGGAISQGQAPSISATGIGVAAPTPSVSATGYASLSPNTSGLNFGNDPNPTLSVAPNPVTTTDVTPNIAPAPVAPAPADTSQVGVTPDTAPAPATDTGKSGPSMGNVMGAIGGAALGIAGGPLGALAGALAGNAIGNAMGGQSSTGGGLFGGLANALGGLFGGNNAAAASAAGYGSGGWGGAAGLGPGFASPGTTAASAGLSHGDPATGAPPGGGNDGLLV